MIDDAKIMQKIELAKYFGLIFVYETSGTLPPTFLLPCFCLQEIAKCKLNMCFYGKMFGYKKKK